MLRTFAGDQRPEHRHRSDVSRVPWTSRCATCRGIRRSTSSCARTSSATSSTAPSSASRRSTVLADEESQRRKLADEQALAGELRVLTKTLSYAKAERAAGAAHQERAVAARHACRWIQRTNTLIITDLPRAAHDRDRPDHHARSRAAAGRDRSAHRADQQELRARARRAVGLQRPRRSGARQHDEPGVSQQRQRSAGRAADAGTGGDRPRTPADRRSTCRCRARDERRRPARSARSTARSISTSRCRRSKRTGNGRVLSTPRVSTQNNVEAEMTQGVQIPIQTVANNTVTGQLQGRGADAEGHAADHRVEHRDHADRRSRTRQADFSRGGQRHSANQHAAREHAGARERRPDDGHRRHLREHRAVPDRPDARPRPDSAAELAVQARHRRTTSSTGAADLHHAAHHQELNEGMSGMRIVRKLLVLAARLVATNSCGDGPQRPRPR